MNRVTWFAFFSLVALSCLDEPDCFQLNNNVIVANFKILGAGADSYPVAGVIAPGSDSIFYQNTATSAFNLPLDPLSTHSEYIFQSSEGPKTLQVDYKRLVQFVSSDCGERYIFSGLDVPAHDFDSVRVVNGTPTTNPSANIEVYRCPRTNIMGITFSDTVAVSTITPDYSGIVYKVSALVTAVNLPLDTARTTTSFVFAYADGTSKKVAVTYRKTLKVIATKCGKQRFIGNLAIDPANTTYSTIKVSNDTIQDLPLSNLAITP